MQTKKNQPPGSVKDISNFLNYCPTAVLVLTLFLTPLFPDEKLNRLKLIVLGAGLVLCSILWALTKVFSSNWTFYRTRLDVLLLVYLIFSSVFYLFSNNPSAALAELQRMIFSVGSFFLAVQVCSNPGPSKTRLAVLRGWMAGLLLVCVYGIMQHSGGWGPVTTTKIERVFATFGNPIFFAAFLILSIPIACSLLIESKNALSVLFYLGTLVLSCRALFYTQTRAAFLALLVSFLLFYFLFDKQKEWRFSKWIWNHKSRAAAFLILIFLFHLAASRTIAGYGSLISKAQAVYHTSRISSFRETHSMLWKDVLQMWKENPWFGTGYGTFHVEFPRYASEELKKVWPQKEKMVNDAHNEYLQILAETGLVGFSVFSSLILVFCFFSMRALKQTGGVLGIGIFCGILALLVQNFFSVDMRFIVSSAYLFFSMGLVFSFFSSPVKVCWPPGIFGLGLKSFWVILFFFVGAGLFFPSLLRPYLAQKALEKTPDFFDENILNKSQTVHDLEKLVLRHPNVPKYWEKLGYTLAKGMQKKDSAGKKSIDLEIAKKAVFAFQKAYELDPSGAGPPNNLGNIFFTLNQRAQAIEWWKKAIASSPESVDPRVNLGLAYYYEGKIKEAAEQFQEVLKRDPKNERAIVMLRHMVE